MYFPYQYPDFVEKRIAGKGRSFNLCTDSYVFSIFNIVDFIEKRIAGKGRLFNFFKFGGASGWWLVVAHLIRTTITFAHLFSSRQW